MTKNKLTNRESKTIYPVSPAEEAAYFSRPAGAYKSRPARQAIGFKRVMPGAVLPTKAHASDSGYDLVAAEDVIIAPGDTVIVPTGIAIKLPPGYEAQVRPRSGVTSRTKLRVNLGTIDAGYGGEIGVIVDNTRIRQHRYNTADVSYVDGSTGKYDAIYPAGTYVISAGDRIAQLVVAPVAQLDAVEIDDIGASDRGSNGYGSTGVR